MTRRALITGIGGQDGSYLAELLLEQGYAVFGVVRRPPAAYAAALAGVLDRVDLVEADLLDRDSLARALDETQPTEVYNLAAPSFVPRSWDEPVLTAEFAAVGVTSLLEAVREVDSSIRVYQASSSEIFGEPRESPQDEETPLNPLTPYGVAKAYGHFIAASYRRRYGMFTSSRDPLQPRVAAPADGLPAAQGRARRGGDLARAGAGVGAGRPGCAARLGLRKGLRPRDVVDAAARPAADYVIATGVSHSVQELVELAFARVGLDWREHVRSDPAFRRGAAELHDLVGDAARARRVLGWEPSVTFEELVGLLVDAEVQALTAANVEDPLARILDAQNP